MIPPVDSPKGIQGRSKHSRHDISTTDEQQRSATHAGRKVRKITQSPVFFGDRFDQNIITCFNQFLSRKEQMVFHRSHFARLSKVHKDYSDIHQNKLTVGLTNFENLEKLIKASPKLCDLSLRGNHFPHGKFTVDVRESLDLNVECIFPKLRVLHLHKIKRKKAGNIVWKFIPALTKLQSLALYRCNYLGNLDLSPLTKLQSLTIKDCYELTNLDLAALTGLQSLTIEECDSLTSLDLAALTNLRSLTIEEGDSLTNLVIPVSIQLQTLIVESSSLQIPLDLSPLTKLERLTLVCKLKSLTLPATTHLQTLTLEYDEVLTSLDLTALTNLLSLTIKSVKAQEVIQIEEQLPEDFEISYDDDSCVVQALKKTTSKG